MKKLLFIITVAVFTACSGEESSDMAAKAGQVENTDTSEDKNVVTIKGDNYTEYYPGTEIVKFEGKLDENGDRMGRWVYFSKNGKELSSTEYVHGKKDGVSIVKYNNGVVRYIGQYKDDKKVGKWTYRNEDGSLDKEVDYSKGE